MTIKIKAKTQSKTKAKARTYKRNNTNTKQSLSKTVKVHPATLKCLKQGHPWILKDQFTEKFPSHPPLLYISNQLGKIQWSFLHDADHSWIKGRIWQQFNPAEPKNQAHPRQMSFAEDLNKRLFQAFQRRSSFIQGKENRENYYLLFGEGDQLPGLFMQKMGDHLLLQYYAFIWKNSLEGLLLQQLEKVCRHFFSQQTFHLWTQERGQTSPFIKRGNFPPLNETATCENGQTAQVLEYGIRYFLDFSRYDFGLYTDMAGPRAQMGGNFRSGQRMLNLFSYTGAFSLLGLQSQMDVTSVDLSLQNMKWLEKNLSLNPQLSTSRHRPLVLSVEKSLELLCQERLQFDHIICDPPSIFSLGGRKLNALQGLETFFAQLLKLLSPGGSLYLFLNTHQISLKRFRKKIEDLLMETSHSHSRTLKKLNLRIGKVLELGPDCPQLDHFPEGSYLKGIEIINGD